MLGQKKPAVLVGSLIFTSFTAQAETEFPTLLARTSFVDTRFLSRPAGQDLPPFILLSQLHGTPTLNVGRPDLPSSYGAVLDAVAMKSLAAFSMGYEGNGNIVSETATAHLSGEGASLWTGVRADRSEPYTNGSGDKVSFGTNRIDAQLAASYRFDPNTKVSVYGIRDAFNNIRLAGNVLDAPDLRRGRGAAIFEKTNLDRLFTSVEASLVYEVSTFTADNYSLRPPVALRFSEYGRYAILRNSIRGKIEDDRWQHEIALDFTRTSSTLTVDYGGVTVGRAAYRQPHTEVATFGLSWSGSTKPAPDHTATFGIRMDVASTRANDTDQTPVVTGASAALLNRSPRQLWYHYYGTDLDLAPTDVNISARARDEWALTSTSDIFINLQRLVREPEGSERYGALGGPQSSIQAGNPNVQPEAHHRLDIGTDPIKEKDRRIMLSAWVDRTHDYITYDRARGQRGILQSDSALIIRNVEAFLSGADALLQWPLSDSTKLSAKATFTRGINLTDDRALYQIPPLSGDAQLVQGLWQDEQITWALTAGLRFAGTQSFIDSLNATGSGLDNGGRTGGYAVVDLLQTFNVGNNFTLLGGVTNLLDKRYRTHLNPLPQGPGSLSMEAPGRSLFITGQVAF